VRGLYSHFDSVLTEHRYIGRFYEKIAVSELGELHMYYLGKGEDASANQSFVMELY
jgi:hypothetical protein